MRVDFTDLTKFPQGGMSQAAFATLLAQLAPRASMTFTDASAGAGSPYSVQTSASTLALLAAGMARFGSVSDASREGLWLEPLASNLVVNTLTVPTGGTGVRTSVSSPAGDTNATRCQVPSGTYGGDLGIASTSGKYYRFSQWQKAGSPGGLYNWFFSSSQSIARGGAAPNTWTRDLTFQDQSHTPFCNPILSSGASLDPITVDGHDLSSYGGVIAGDRDVDIYGPQVEQGHVATSLILSGASPVTRQPGILAIGSPASLLNAGKLNVELIITFHSSRTEYDPAVNIPLIGNATEGVFLQMPAGVVAVRSGGVTRTLSALEWSAGDVLDINVVAGGGTPSFGSYRAQRAGSDVWNGPYSLGQDVASIPDLVGSSPYFVGGDGANTPLNGAIGLVACYG
jgi:hypothetical protein